MPSKRTRITLLCVLLCWTVWLQAQSDNAAAQRINTELGLPHVQNYGQEVYGATQDNWATVQDSTGVLYFGNGGGVLTFDGVDWSLISLPNKPTILAMATDDHGGVFAGGVKTLGYLTSDSIGQLAYVSLNEKLPAEYRGFNSIRSIYAVHDVIYFCSEVSIFIWDYKTMKVIHRDKATSCFSANGEMYLTSYNEPLKTIVNDTISGLLNVEKTQGEVVTAITNYTEDEILIVSQSGLFIYDGHLLKRVQNNFQDFFDKNNVFSALKMDDGTIILASFYKGILFSDANGQELYRLSSDNQLESSQAFHLFQDRSGILWASLYGGIAKIEYPSPFSYFNEHNGSPDLINKFWRTDNGLLLASGTGLYVMNGNTVTHYNEEMQFHLTSIVTHSNDIFVAGEGLWLIQNNNSTKLLSPNIHYLMKSKIDSNRIYIAANTYFTSIYKSNNTWKKEANIAEVDGAALLIKEDKLGGLWISSYGSELTWMSFATMEHAKKTEKSIVQVLTEEHGIPASNRKYQEVFIIDDQIYIQTDDLAVLVFNRSSEQFEKDEQLLSRLGVTKEAVQINAVDNNENVWLIEKEQDIAVEQLVAWKQSNGNYQLSSLNEARMMNYRSEYPYPELQDSIVWYKSAKGAVRHDYRKSIKQTPNRTRITKVICQSDSLIYGGHGVSNNPNFSHHENQLRFQFASPSFLDETKNSYQFYLEGFDEVWSSWSTEVKKDYTNIPVGNYIFKVRSKNVMHQISEPATYSFSILPPWYRHWGMYILYGLAVVGIVIWMSRWRSNKLQRANLILENKISERTDEIRQKNELLGQQATKLVELDNVKTQLYNNITHEFRTPLTVIQGMTESIETSLANEQIEETSVPIEMIKRNGKKLLKLISEMLDLAKIESGSMQLQMVQADIIPYIKYLCESFHSLAQQKDINLVVYSEIESLLMDFDSDKIAVIISNLLSNAIKFTPAHGKIIVHLNQLNKEANCYLSIKIKDTGVGIDAKEVAHVFDKFYQVNDSKKRESEGTGIGLALTKELVHLMNGHIHVESTIDVGSIFSIEIPRTTTANLGAVPTDFIEGDALLSNQLIPVNQVESQTVDQNTSKPDLLIIEDNMDVAYYLRQCLQDLYNISHAENGSSGIEMALEHIPDIIISDVMMPEKDGFEVCVALKSNVLTDHIPIILLTAKATAQDRLAGFSFGADAYLAKPFVKAELLSRLNQLVLQRQKLLKKFEQGSLSQMLNARIENPETKFLQKAIRIIQQEMTDASFGSVLLAQKLQLSESQVYRKLKAITDKSTAVFIRSVRLQKAKEEIQLTNKTISEVAYDMGFNDPAYFSRVFKEEFGFAPSELKNNE